MRDKSGITGAVALLAALLATFLWLNMLAGPWRLASGLADAKTQLSKAQKALSAGTTKEARYEALASRASVRRAQAGLDSHSPLLALAKIVPKVRDALSQVPHFVSAARYSSDAAIGTLNIAQNVLRGPDKVIVKVNGGTQIRIDRIEAIGRAIGHVLDDIDHAKAQLKEVNLSKIPHRFRLDVKDGVKKAVKTQKLLGKARAGFKILPDFLGANGPRTYLLGMQNSAELRGSGGALLQFAILQIANGAPNLAPSSTVYNIDKNRNQVSIPLPPDAWYVKGIPDAQRFGNANWSPDWPLSAKLTVAYGHATPKANLPKIDGVIAVDPIVMQDLLPGTGPFTIKSGNRISSGKIIPFLLFKAYASFPVPAVRRIVLHTVVDDFYKRIFHPLHASALVKGLGKALADKHMQVWLADPTEDAFIKRMHWDGALDPAPHSDYLDVVEQNVGGNKLDYFSTQTTTASVAIDGTGAHDSVMVDVHNGVFLPQPRYSMGDSGPWHRPMISVYVQPSATLTKSLPMPTCTTATVSPTPCRRDAPAPAVWTNGSPPTYSEVGKQVWPATLEIPPMEDGTIGYEYTMPNVVRTIGNRQVYTLVLQHQPKLHPDTADIKLTLPAGATKVKAPGWKAVGNGILEWSHPLITDKTLQVSWHG